MKLITVIIYGFCNKLECLSLASLSALSSVLRTNTMAYYGSVNYDRNKIYDTGLESVHCTAQFPNDTAYRGILIERDGSVQLTSFYELVWIGCL